MSTSPFSAVPLTAAAAALALGLSAAAPALADDSGARLMPEGNIVDNADDAIVDQGDLSGGLGSDHEALSEGNGRIGDDQTSAASRGDDFPGTDDDDAEQAELPPAEPAPLGDRGAGNAPYDDDRAPTVD
ncbi:hypothetical protein [Caenispirillum bisanense]|uniref:hypothetical protein n=1 Tax=Caenispirillum bisanense TaxID=414052 RepID=UPI0031DC5D01